MAHLLGIHSLSPLDTAQDSLPGEKGGGGQDSHFHELNQDSFPESCPEAHFPGEFQVLSS